MAKRKQKRTRRFTVEVIRKPNGEFTFNTSCFMHRDVIRNGLTDVALFYIHASDRDREAFAEQLGVGANALKRHGLTRS